MDNEIFGDLKGDPMGYQKKKNYNPTRYYIKDTYSRLQMAYMNRADKLFRAMVHGLSSYRVPHL